MTKQATEKMESEREEGGDVERKAEDIEPQQPEKKKKEYEIDIFRDWCKSCGICAAFCPRQCITLDAEGSPEVDTSGQCTGCGWCEVHCPDFAISVRRRKAKRVQVEEDEVDE